MTARLNTGFSTGSCAAAAAKAAASVLCGVDPRPTVEIPLPAGGRLALPLAFVDHMGTGARAGIKKDAGGDADITHGVTVIASVRLLEAPGIRFAAGEGVGIVTLPGLSVPPGEPAINPGPRAMIEAAIREVTARGALVTVSIPGGRELAAKTFNPRLGIVGGLSVLGTSGLVRPYSHAAVIEALFCGLDVAVASGYMDLVFVPGRIGQQAARRHLHATELQIVDAGNEWGALVDRARQRGVRRLLALGHPGKLAKLAAGQWDTHSSRSQPAVAIVAEFARTMFNIDCTGLPTVEGVFQVLGGPQRQALARALAERIREAIQARLGPAASAAAALIDMAGEWLGESGDLSPWKPADR